MQWISENSRHVLAASGVLIWLAVMAGPWIVAQTKNAAAEFLATVQRKTNLLNVAPLCFVVAVYLWPTPAAPVPVEPPRVPDIVDTCAASGRVLLADALEDFATHKYDTDEAREEAINEKILDVVEAANEPLHEAIAKAIKTGRVSDCADRIRKGELRSE